MKGKLATQARITSWWLVIRESLWFVPTACTLVAISLAVLLVRVDRIARFDRRDDLPWWVFGGGPEGVRSVLSAIAGTTITVTGVVFSITVVALQLASSQFSPLVLRRFRADHGNQVVLGAFIGTFTYALLVLRSVLSPEQDSDGFVPVLAATVAIVLVLISVGFLIFFIHHAARSVQASTIIDRALEDTLGVIQHLYPEDVGDPDEAVPSPPSADTAAIVTARQGGYFQAVDQDTLFELSEDRSLAVRIERTPGDYVLPGSALASVWPASAVDTDLKTQIHSAFVLGTERTLQSDIELGIRQIADIGIKALSPGINDPTTAILRIDHLSHAMVQLGQRVQPHPVRVGEHGDVRVYAIGPSFDRLVEVAFAQLRQYGAGDATVSAHLVTVLGRLAALLPPERREPLVRQALLVIESARAGLAVQGDRERVHDAASWIPSRET
jgi:uncharacterized membrane protein